jgi:hypothetical protein
VWQARAFGRGEEEQAAIDFDHGLRILLDGVAVTPG